MHVAIPRLYHGVNYSKSVTQVHSLLSAKRNLHIQIDILLLPDKR